MSKFPKKLCYLYTKRRLKFLHFRRVPESAIRLKLLSRGWKRKQLGNRYYMSVWVFGRTKFVKRGIRNS